MALREFDTLVQSLVISVPTCPFPVIEKHVRENAILVCERTLAWRYLQPPITLSPGLYDYPYENPPQSEVHAFLTVTVNGYPVRPVTIEEMLGLYPNWPENAFSHMGTPRYVTQIDVDNFAVAPTPNRGTRYDISMILALKPLRDATGMEESALDDLEDVISHGALRDLLILPGKPWSDRELASYHAQQFNLKINERRARANLGTGRATVAVRPRAFV